MKANYFHAYFVFSLFLFSDLTGQTTHKPLAASYLGLAAYTPDHTDVFSFTSNQASLAQLKNTSVAIHSERRFLLAELNNYTAVIGLSTQSGNFGVKAYYSGFSDYTETQLGLAYARRLGKKMDLGVQFNYNGLRIAGYGNASTISFELGTILHLAEKFHAGIHINNPVGGKLGKNQEEKLPSEYAVGFGYDASEKFFISTEIEKEEDQPVNVITGFEYKFISQLFARAGISSATSSAWFGFGLLIRSTRLDITCNYHPQLGITPGLLLLFTFSKNEK